MMRTSIPKILSVGLLALALGSLPTARSQQSAAQQSAQPASQRALLDQYCVGCHNQRLKTADLMLDKADPANPTSDPEMW